MRFLKSVAALFLGLVELALAYHILNFPPVPVFSVYITATLWEEDVPTLSRIVAVFLCAALGCALYGYNIYLAIAHYPMYGNWLGILFDAFILFLIMGAGFMFCSSFLEYRRR